MRPTRTGTPRVPEGKLKSGPRRLDRTSLQPKQVRVRINVDLACLDDEALRRRTVRLAVEIQALDETAYRVNAAFRPQGQRRFDEPCAHGLRAGYRSSRFGE